MKPKCFFRGCDHKMETSIAKRNIPSCSLRSQFTASQKLPLLFPNAKTYGISKWEPSDVNQTMIPPYKPFQDKLPIVAKATLPTFGSFCNLRILHPLLILQVDCTTFISLQTCAAEDPIAETES